MSVVQSIDYHFPLSFSVAGRPLDQKYSEPNIAPPSYADVVGEARSPTHSER